MTARFILASFLLFASAPSFSTDARSDDCPWYQFPKEPRATELVGASLAKVYAADSGGASMGTATVVDSKGGLLLTASHVTPKDDVYLLFPALGDGKRHAATVVARVPQSDQESTGASWGEPRDIAILKLAEPMDFLNAVEVWMSDLVASEQYNVLGFPNDAQTPNPAKGGHHIPNAKQAGPNGSACTRFIKIATKAGESGAPVFDDKGLIVGMMISSEYFDDFGKFIPAKCFAPLLIESLGDNRGKQVLTKIVSVNAGRAKNLLKPRAQRERVTNLELAAAIMWSAATGDPEVPGSHHKCPIRRAVQLRGIGEDRYDSYHSAWAFRHRKTAEQAKKPLSAKKAEADTLQKEGNQLIKEGHLKEAAVMLEAAVKDIDAYVAAKTWLAKFQALTGFQNQFWAGINADAMAIKETAADNNSVSSSLKAKADVLTQLYDLKGRADLLTQAQQTAALSYKYAKDDSARAQASSAFAVASQKAGLYEVAIQAYSTAFAGGVKTKWLKDNYNYAFTQRDNVSKAVKASDYAAPGEYKEVDPKLMDFYASRSGLKFTTADKGTPVYLMQDKKLFENYVATSGNNPHFQKVLRERNVIR